VSNAEEGRAAFHHMIHGFEKVSQKLASVAASNEKSAEAIETLAAQVSGLVQQNDVLIQQNKDLMLYSGALQTQIGVLCDLIASQSGVQHQPLPVVSATGMYQDPLGALGQHIVNGIVGGFAGGGSRARGR
jgi:hypothetical protein